MGTVMVAMEEELLAHLTKWALAEGLAVRVLCDAAYVLHRPHQPIPKEIRDNTGLWHK